MAQGNPLQFNFRILTSPRIIKWRRQRPNTSSNLGYTRIYVTGRFEEHAIYVSFRRNNFSDHEAVRRLRNLLLKAGEKSSYPINRVSVGHCKDVDLLDHFFKFMENLKVNTDFLVGISMDWPNVNKSFKRKLVNKLAKDKGNSFLSWLVCITHCEQWFRGRFETIKVVDW